MKRRATLSVVRASCPRIGPWRVLCAAIHSPRGSDQVPGAPCRFSIRQSGLPSLTGRTGLGLRHVPLAFTGPGLFQRKAGARTVPSPSGVWHSLLPLSALPVTRCSRGDRIERRWSTKGRLTWLVFEEEGRPPESPPWLIVGGGVFRDNTTLVCVTEIRIIKHLRLLCCLPRRPRKSGGDCSLG